MKIVCPECQAAYEIDVPDSPSKNLSAKCAACHSTFPIKKQSLAESNHAHDQMTGPPLAQIDSGQAEESTDDFLSGLQDDLKEFEGLDQPHEESTDEKNLDDYLNQLMEEDVGETDKEVMPEPDSRPEPDSSQPTSAMPSEDELDQLFDSLIADEIKSPEENEEETADATALSENDQEEENLDAILDEIILNNLDEGDEQKPESPLSAPESETAEVDAPVPDSSEDTGQEIEIPELENLSSENNEDEVSEEDILAEASSQEIALTDEEEDSIETSVTPQETADSTPADEQQEEEKSDEDLWAEAFADQEAVKEDGEKETIEEKQEEEKPEEEKSDEDLWAEAFADQEAVKEDGEKESTEEQPKEEVSDEDLWAEAFADQEAIKEDEKETTEEKQEEEKSDEDLWAEAFADQEAVKEDGEKETTEEQPKEEVSAKDDDPEEVSGKESVEEPQEEPQDDSKEVPETVEQEEDITAEEIVAADMAMDSDEDDEPEANEFGISESDYDDDDIDEEEFSTPKKKKSIFSLPTTRTGKLVLGGGVLAVLLTAGGVYFALQTLAPSELTEMAKNPSEIPEGLQPKDVQENKSEAPPAPADKPNAALTAALGTEDSAPPAVDTKKPDPADSLTETENSSGVSRGLVAALAPGNHAVQLATIMPVAYNISDIRVLSFNLEAEMSDAESARVIRDAMPVFEKITVTTVEQLLDKKFFNDILYVKEKLKKNLQNNFNKTLKGGGRVKKITFREFTVQ
jgi:predicted Zn finger-like uncharacterized protein